MKLIQIAASVGAVAAAPKTPSDATFEDLMLDMRDDFNKIQKGNFPKKMEAEMGEIIQSNLDFALEEFMAEMMPEPEGMDSGYGENMPDGGVVSDMAEKPYNEGDHYPESSMAHHDSHGDSGGNSQNNFGDHNVVLQGNIVINTNGDFMSMDGGDKDKDHHERDTPKGSPHEEHYHKPVPGHYEILEMKDDMMNDYHYCSMEVGAKLHYMMQEWHYAYANMYTHNDTAYMESTDDKPMVRHDHVDDMTMNDKPMDDMSMHDMPMDDMYINDKPMHDMPMDDMPKDDMYMDESKTREEKIEHFKYMIEDMCRWISIEEFYMYYGEQMMEEMMNQTEEEMEMHQQYYAMFNEEWLLTVQHWMPYKKHMIYQQCVAKYQFEYMLEELMYEDGMKPMSGHGTGSYDDMKPTPNPEGEKYTPTGSYDENYTPEDDMEPMSGHGTGSYDDMKPTPNPEEEKYTPTGSYDENYTPEDDMKPMSGYGTGSHDDMKPTPNPEGENYTSTGSYDENYTPEEEHETGSYDNDMKPTPNSEEENYTSTGSYDE